MEEEKARLVKAIEAFHGVLHSVYLNGHGRAGAGCDMDVVV
jgi:hypothetical protein